VIKLPNKPDVIEQTALSVRHEYTLDQIEEYGLRCAKFAIEEATKRISAYAKDVDQYLPANTANHIWTARDNIECMMRNLSDELK
jgi:hypothetical protein